MRQKRRKFSAKFKTKVVLEALQERSTIHELASKHEIHANQISMWKRQFLDNASSAFESGPNTEAERLEEENELLYKKIGKLQVSVDFLKKSLDEN